MSRALRLHNEGTSLAYIRNPHSLTFVMVDDFVGREAVSQVFANEHCYGPIGWKDDSREIPGATA